MSTQFELFIDRRRIENREMCIFLEISIRSSFDTILEDYHSLVHRAYRPTRYTDIKLKRRLPFQHLHRMVEFDLSLKQILSQSFRICYIRCVFNH